MRDYLSRPLEHFDSVNGGSWLYMEVDPGFKWECVEALFEAAMQL